MTRKHFVAIARQLSMTRPTVPGPVLSQWERDVQSVADALSLFNVSFNRHRFLDACYE